MTNEKLDRKAAKLQGWWQIKAHGETVWTDDVANLYQDYRPTTNSAQAMELLEKYKLSVSYVQNVWICGNANSQVQGALAEADTPQVAIVKAVIKLLEQSDEHS